MTFSKTLVFVLALIAPTGGERQPGDAWKESSAALARADINNDGVVTKAEFINARTALFSDLDRGRKGYVSVNAIPGFAGSTARGAAARDLLRSADRNHDGRVTWAEFATAPTPNFDRADIDHNGRLDRSEQSYFARLAERDR